MLVCLLVCLQAGTDTGLGAAHVHFIVDKAKIPRRREQLLNGHEGDIEFLMQRARRNKIMES